MSASASSSRRSPRSRSLLGSLHSLPLVGPLLSAVLARVSGKHFGARARHAAMSGLFSPRKPRNALLRLGLGLVGVGLLAALLIVGVIVGAAMLAIGLTARALKRRGRPQAAYSRTVTAEYRVLRKPRLPAAPVGGR
jgi:hypothetical protein